MKMQGIPGETFLHFPPSGCTARPSVGGSLRLPPVCGRCHPPQPPGGDDWLFESHVECELAPRGVSRVGVAWQGRADRMTATAGAAASCPRLPAAPWQPRPIWQLLPVPACLVCEQCIQLPAPEHCWCLSRPDGAPFQVGEYCRCPAPRWCRVAGLAVKPCSILGCRCGAVCFVASVSYSACCPRGFTAKLLGLDLPTFPGVDLFWSVCVVEMPSALMPPALVGRRVNAGLDFFGPPSRLFFAEASVWPDCVLVVLLAMN